MAASAKELGGRAGNYSTGIKTADDTREERITRLKSELREHIRYLSDYAFLSADWIRMADSLQQISNVAFMETHLPAAKVNPLNQTGKKDTGTLWDQERDELAVRILLEEGKLNLLLRLLHAFKTNVRNGTYSQMKASAAATSNSTAGAMDHKAVVFEESVGLLLHYALRHLEALQILDIPELIAHIAEVLEDESKDRGSGHLAAAIEEHKGATAYSQRKLGDKVQGRIVCHYLRSISMAFEHIDEERVMDLMEEHKVFQLAIDHLHKKYLKHTIGELKDGALFLADIFKSDTFSTDQDRFLSSKELKQMVYELRDLFVQKLVTDHNLPVKDVRPLLDMFKRLEPVFGRAPSANAAATSAGVEP